MDNKVVRKFIAGTKIQTAKGLHFVGIIVL